LLVKITEEYLLSSLKLGLCSVLSPQIYQIAARRYLYTNIFGIFLRHDSVCYTSSSGRTNRISGV